MSSTFCSYKITITATFFGCPILLIGFHTFFFAVSLYILFRLSHFTFGLPYVLFCGVVIHTFFRLSHFAFELPYVLFLRCRYTYFFRENDHPKNAISSTFCSYKRTITITATFFGFPILLLGFHTFFFAVSLYILFRLSHFTFGLPYVLFCGVVIHTFFVCPILLLSFHTFFFCGVVIHTFFGKMITRKTQFLQLFVVIKEQ